MAIEDLYSTEFYAENLRNHLQYEALGNCIHALFTPGDAYDVGCGAGLVLAQLASYGWDVQGVDGSKCAIAACPESIRSRVGIVDLLGPWNFRTQCCDVAICVEVAEHLPAHAAAQLVWRVSELPRFSGHIVWSAATPGQGGVDHVNEQPHTYWLSMFRDQQWEPDLVKSWALRSLMWESQAQHCYAWENFFVFRREV
jgi:2-polyprenyl-3-methyl-5-hydroxy-6-metoxy-1,4-benzoquinol methylase